MGMLATVRPDHEPESQYGCGSKFAFESKLTAIAASRRVRHPSSNKVRAYLCESCGKWHLTSTPERGKGKGRR